MAAVRRFRTGHSGEVTLVSGLGESRSRLKFMSGCRHDIPHREALTRASCVSGQVRKHTPERLPSWPGVVGRSQTETPCVQEHRVRHEKMQPRSSMPSFSVKIEHHFFQRMWVAPNNSGCPVWSSRASSVIRSNMPSTATRPPRPRFDSSTGLLLV